MFDDAFTVISRELQKVEGPKNQTGDSIMICCPFHDERSPSCGVNMSTEKEVRVGTFYCFEKNTRVMTQRGTKRIRKLSGSTHKVLTDDGVWVDAKFSAFGKQQLYKLTVTRNGVTKDIFTTAEHDWYTHQKKGPVKTVDLVPGRYLQTNPLTLEKGLNMNEDAVRHGFVFGDGSFVRSQAKGCSDITHSRAYLYAHKIDFMYEWYKHFPIQFSYDYSHREVGYTGKQIIIDYLPKEWKSLPTTSSDSDYIYGFLAGMLAADGCVDKAGTVSLHNSSKKVLQRVRNLATRIGINTLSITCQMRKGYGDEDTPIYRLHFPRGSFPSELLLNPEHRRRFEATPPKYDYLRWKVVSVEETDRVETVYCCVVPGTHRFTLEDNILTGNCFGCKEKGGWNRLAEKAGLEQIKEWQNIEARTDGSMVRFDKKKAEQIGTKNMTIQRLFDEVGNAVLPWPKGATWRSYSGKLINRVEGYVYDDVRFDELMLVLPIYINGRYRGGVRALREKPRKGPSYFNTTGDWSKDYGLLGFDYMRKKKLYGCKAIVLTEGPRDWLRMVKNKIPCCSILGSAMFSKKKLMLLMGMGIEKIYVFPDNDKAGYAMAELVEETCEGLIPFEFLRLPRKKDENGKIIELDPDNAPQKFIDKVKGILYEHQR